MNEPVLEEIFVTTKQECQQAIDKANNVCDRCGGILSPIKTVDNANNPTHWTGCSHCMVFTGGVKRDIFEIAKRMVDDGYVAYHHSEGVNENSDYELIEMWRESQISGTCDVVRQVLRLQKLII